ncbi:MAG: phospho-sugar mutase [Aquihabitans sp.]
MGVDADLLDRARSWLAADPDPITRDELDEVITAADGGDEAAAADLADRFAMDLDFGTAGLRGRLGAGPNRMNLAVVTRAANGIVQWLKGSGDPDVATKGVAVCFDARHRSQDFAERTAAIFAAAGIRAHVLPGPLPTPVLAFAVAHLGAAAGVMVTASHNPPQDNGYKVYDGSARQIVPPVDGIIAAAIDATPRACDVMYAHPEDPDIVRHGDELVQAYLDRASAVGLVPEARSVVAAYTAMHGVGASNIRRAFAAAGFAPVVEVEAQVEPDPDFPTVPFPNPEEPGALDLGIATATAAGADLLLANDPDADRLGGAVPDPTALDGWRPLRGDEIGVLLAHHLLSFGGIAPGAVLATTIVSSTLLGKMAAKAGVPFVETLTGFKWLGRAADPDGELAFGYEEALGYCAGGIVRDKDGCTAALLLTEATAVQKADGRTLLDVLDDLAVEHGVHQTVQWSVRVAGTDAMEQMTGAMARMRATPPTELAGRAVQRVDDLIDGDEARGFEPSDVLTWYLDGARVVVRPSGTEPKLKAYVEVVEPVAERDDLAAARDRAKAEVDQLVAAVAATTRLA